MSDNVAITAGTGTSIATDDCGAGGHAQIVKLGVATDGSATPIPADANGLLVNLGTNNDVTVTGSVTANAGTNLNTSALALETGGNLAAAATSLALLDNAISGNEMQVDVVGSLPAGTAYIGKARLTDGTTDAEVVPLTGYNAQAVAIVDGAGDQITSFGGGTQYTESATDASITGTAMLMEGAADTLLPVQGTVADGLLVNLGTNNDVTVTSGTITTVTAVTAITNALPAGTNNIGDVDVLTLPALPAGTNNIGDVDILSIAAGDNNIGNVDIVTMPNVVIGSGTVTTVSTVTNLSQLGGAAISMGTGARDAGTQRVTIATNDAVPVTFTGSTDVATQTTLASVLTSVQLNDDKIYADEAAFTLASSKVGAIGGYAVAHTTAPDATAAGTVGIPLMNRHRILFTMGGHPNAQLASLNVSDADGAQTNAAIITAAAGTKIVVTHLAVTLDAATTATGGVQCRIGFGTANTPALDAAKVLMSHSGIAAGSGVVLGNGGGILGIGADDEDVRITCEDPVGGNLDVVIGYYTIES